MPPVWQQLLSDMGVFIAAALSLTMVQWQAAVMQEL